MTRLQSCIGVLTVLACLAVGIWASQRPASPELITEIGPARLIFPPVETVAHTTADSDEALIQAIIDEESATAAEVIPRKLTVDDEKSAADHPLRQLLTRELQNATPEEREIWFEQLRSLPLSAAEDVLKIRRNAEPLTRLQDTIAPQKITTKIPGNPPPESAFSAGMRSALQKYRAVALQNLLNADTIGYRCVEPQLGAFPIAMEGEERLPADGLRWVGSRLSLRQGVFETTDRPLDLAIAGAGWFVVTDAEGQLAFTRNGSFELNDRRTLELITSAGPRAVHPPITLPEKLAQVFIDSNGSIYGRIDGKTFDDSPVLGHIQLARFFDDSALQLSEDGLYRPLPKAGEMVRRAPGDQCGSLREGMLERANVNVELQQHALQRIEKWLSLPSDFDREPQP